MRRISTETAFPEGAGRVFSDNEVLADALTRYFTDYEPESCFVAVRGQEVAGYITGAKDAAAMWQVFKAKIFFPLVLKALLRGVFLRPGNLRFFFHLLRSAAAGEFRAPDFSREYPAILHINIHRGLRGQGIGRALVERYLDHLRRLGIAGVSFGTLSGSAREFFLKTGFRELFRGRRSYFLPYTGKEANFFLFGVKL